MQLLDSGDQVVLDAGSDDTISYQPPAVLGVLAPPRRSRFANSSGSQQFTPPPMRLAASATQAEILGTCPGWSVERLLPVLDDAMRCDGFVDDGNAFGSVPLEEWMRQSSDLGSFAPGQGRLPHAGALPSLPPLWIGVVGEAFGDPGSVAMSLDVSFGG